LTAWATDAALTTQATWATDAALTTQATWATDTSGRTTI